MRFEWIDSFQYVYVTSPSEWNKFGYMKEMIVRTITRLSVIHLKMLDLAHTSFKMIMLVDRKQNSIVIKRMHFKEKNHDTMISHLRPVII